MSVKIDVNYEEMGGRIRRERLRSKWTQGELAEKADISTSFLGHIERGSRIASVETLAQLSRVLGVSIDFLVYGDMSSGDFDKQEPLSDKQRRMLNDMARVLRDHLSEDWPKK